MDMSSVGLNNLTPVHQYKSLSNEDPSEMDCVAIDIPIAPVIPETVPVLSCETIAKHVLEAFSLQKSGTLADALENDANEEGHEVAFDPDTFYKFFTQEILAPQERSKKERSYTILAKAESLVRPAWYAQPGPTILSCRNSYGPILICYTEIENIRKYLSEQF